MANYKNQNLITDISVEKIKHIKDTNVSFMQPFDWDKVKPWLFLLSGNAFKLYMYLLSWAGKKEYQFSPADIVKRLDFKEDTARTIFKQFLEWGFLKQVEAHKYTFDPYPEKALQIYKDRWIEKFGAGEVV